MDNAGSIYSLIDALIRKGILTSSQGGEALKAQRSSNQNINDILIEKIGVSEDDLIRVESEVWNIPLLTQRHLDEADPRLLQAIPKQISQMYNLFPIKKENGYVLLAMHDPFDLIALDNIKRITQCQPRPLMASRRMLQIALSMYDNRPAGANQPAARAKVGPPDALSNISTKSELKSPAPNRNVNIPPALSPNLDESKALDSILSKAITDNASDIHFSPTEKGLRVRYRIDGILFDLFACAAEMREVVVSRIKVMAQLNIAEKRLPQDGGLSYAWKSRRIDFRVSTLPTLYGEKIVLRVLKNDDPLTTGTFEDLGMDIRTQNTFVKHLLASHGMILITGHSGSGKTTTLYTLLNYLRSSTKNIVTVEDPIEYRLGGIEQVQVKQDIGFDFAQALRAILRQDPDILMIGEIRDPESARIAVRAAVGGHMVFSTLHTSDASGAITRLLNLGVEPYLVASSVTLAAAQRLVRKICGHCKESYQASADEKQIMQIDPDEELTLYRGKGCIYCRNTGYSSRAAVFEVLEVTPDLMRMITTSPSTDIIRRKALADGMVTLLDRGSAMAREGITTLSEVTRTCMVEV